MNINHSNRQFSGYLAQQALLVLGGLVLGANLVAAQTLSQEQALNQVLSDNPGLHSIQARAQVLATLPRQRGALPDPRLSLISQYLPVDIVAVLATYWQADDQDSLFQDILLTQARQTAEYMLAGYQVNRVGFLSLIRSETFLYEYENHYWRAYSSAHQVLAQQVMVVGKEKFYE